jgi:hypothetical protein
VIFAGGDAVEDEALGLKRAGHGAGAKWKMEDGRWKKRVEGEK